MELPYNGTTMPLPDTTGYQIKDQSQEWVTSIGVVRQLCPRDHLNISIYCHYS